MNYEENLAYHWDREVSSRIHKQKLENIKNREFKQLNKSLAHQLHNRKSNLDRSVEISRENKILYEKLVTISERKLLILVQRQSANLTPKVPNLKSKKIEANRIKQENLHLVNKLSANNSELSFKKMIKDYEVISEYRDRISRKRFQERITKAVKVSTTPKNYGKETPSSKRAQARTLLKRYEGSAETSENKRPSDLDPIKERTLE